MALNLIVAPLIWLIKFWESKDVKSKIFKCKDSICKYNKNKRVCDHLRNGK